MPRLARIVVPGYPHHVTQRGNHRQQVFFADSDRDTYLALKKKYFESSNLRDVGFCLMTTHTHDICIPENADSLARGFRGLHGNFSQFQNLRLNRTGHLWQARFFSTPLDEEHFWFALRYVELNPVRAGIVEYPWDWPWSSARSHVTGIDKTGLLDMKYWSERFGSRDWKNFLLDGMDALEEHERIRKATRTGRPLGSENFICLIESVTGRSIRPKKPGPKPGFKRARLSV